MARWDLVIVLVGLVAVICCASMVESFEPCGKLPIRKGPMFEAQKAACYSCCAEHGLTMFHLDLFIWSTDCQCYGGF